MTMGLAWGPQGERLILSGGEPSRGDEGRRRASDPRDAHPRAPIDPASRSPPNPLVDWVGADGTLATLDMDGFLVLSPDDTVQHTIGFEATDDYWPSPTTEQAIVELTQGFETDLALVDTANGTATIHELGEDRMVDGDDTGVFLEGGDRVVLLNVRLFDGDRIVAVSSAGYGDDREDETRLLDRELSTVAELEGSPNFGGFVDSPVRAACLGVGGTQNVSVVDRRGTEQLSVTADRGELLSVICDPAGERVAAVLYDAETDATEAAVFAT